MNSTRIFTPLCILFLAVFLAAGCQSATKKDGADKAQKKDSPIIAEYEGGVITADDVNQFLNNLQPFQKAQLLDPQKKTSFINQIVESAVLANAARGLGLDKNPEVQATIKIYENNILAEKYYSDEIKPLSDQVQISDEELKKYYDEHQSEFSNGQIKARHILVPSEEEAKRIHAQLKADPSKFAQLAKEKSIDPSNKDKGGDLEWFGRGRMVPEFENVAFSTPKGQLSEPVKTRFGWHIIFVEDKTETDVTPFEQAKETIRGKLLNDKKKELVDGKLKEVKDKVKLKIHEENFGKVGEEPPAAPGGAGLPPAPPAPQSQPAGK